MTDRTAALLTTTARLLREVIGEEWADDVDIDLGTSFADDLELESIEFVELSEKLQATYPGVDFASWLSNLELDQIMQLSVGDVVAFLEQATA